MKRFCMAGAAILTMTVSAYSADLPTRTYTKAPIAASVYNWTGFYIGAHVGYGWGGTSSIQYDMAGNNVGSGSVDRNGIIGGGQLGYNYQFAPNWVLGIEADISASDLNASSGGCSATGCSTIDSSVEYFGTVRGRLGYAADNVLLYGTGGLLWAHASSNRTITSVTAGGIAQTLVGQVSSSSGTPTGWVAGAGIEWGFAPNWTTRIEYLYGEWDSHNSYRYTFINTNPDRDFDVKAHLNIVRLGLNYRF